MFKRNEALLGQYYANHAESRETLVDFGVIPEDEDERKDWEAEASRFITALRARAYQVTPAMYDGDSGLCPVYTVRLDKMDFQGPAPAELGYLQWNVKRLCQPGQTAETHERVLDIHVLGDQA